jgi:hypothetical protein
MARAKTAASARSRVVRWRGLAVVLLVWSLAGADGVLAEPRAEGVPPGSTLISLDPVPPPPPPPPPPAPVPQVPVAELRIDLSEQRLSAFDAEHRLLYRRLVSTGLPVSPTPSGTFTVASRFPSTTLTGRDYKIPAVPNVLCLGGGGLKPDSICIHPAPWQEAAGEPFGVRRSHGCVRTSSATARWLFERTAVGTPVIIQP